MCEVSGLSLSLKPTLLYCVVCIEHFVNISCDSKVQILFFLRLRRRLGFEYDSQYYHDDSTNPAASRAG